LKPVVASTAYLLISHGSRDPRPQEAMNRLADLVRKHLETARESARESADIPSNETVSQDSALSLSEQIGQIGDQAHRGHTLLLTRPRRDVSPTASCQIIVGTACLELSPLSLSEQIYNFALRLRATGIEELKLLHMFLMPGVHVLEDIPKEVEAARELLKGDDLKLTLCPHLGSHQKITDVLASRLASVPAEASLLVAHGSRKPKGNQAIRRLAQHLGTQVAYWATPPDIETQVIELMQQGCQKLTILPYFLFAGGITDAIIHRTEELAERFPQVNFRLLPTLGATDEVADLAVELVY
jgi:sirohydrochlorin cobaltochelatase